MPAQLAKQVRLSAQQAFAVPAIVPEDSLEIGWVAGAHGIRGGLRAETYSGDFDTLRKCESIWLELHGAWYSAKVASVDVRPGFALLHITNLDSRNDAEMLHGARIVVARGQLPTPEKETFYWVDLVGCAVANVQSVPLGTIESLIATGAHDVLSISDSSLKSGSRLIPFVDAYVKSVDINSKRVVVDWDVAWDEG